MAVNLSMLAGAGAQFFDNNGVILSGGKLYTYAAGTTTPQATYTTSAGNVSHTNPIVLNSAGRVASGGEIWLTEGTSYKFGLETSTAVTIATYDNVTGNGSGIASSIYATFAAPSGSSLVGYLPEGNAVATTVQSKLREIVSVMDFGAVGDGVTDDTIAIQTAINTSQNVFFPQATYLITSLFATTDTCLEGEYGTVILFNNAAPFDGITVTLTGAYNGFGIKNIKFQNNGVLGNTLVTTPKDADGFDNDHYFFFENLIVIGTGFTTIFDIGDCNRGTMFACDLRGNYNPANIDAGQTPETALKLSAAKGSIGFNFFNNNVSGFRTGINISENVEGFVIADSEIKNGWYGVFSSMTTQKPGGFINNMHVSVNKYPLFIGNRRHFQVSNFQAYRSSGFFDHTEEFVGMFFSSCQNFNVNGSSLRTLPYTNASKVVGMLLNGCQSATVDTFVCGEPAEITYGIEIKDTEGATFNGIVCEEPVTHAFYIYGNSRDVAVGNNEIIGTAPAVPIFISVTSIDFISIDRNSGYIEKYEETSFVDTSPDVTLYAGVNALYQKINLLAGSAGAYTVEVNLSRDNTQKGDTFNFRLVLANSTNGTLIIKDAVSGTLATLNNTSGALQYRDLTAVFNGTGWVTQNFSAALA